jgi:16S rRNA (cytosine1402-N4)-methyltransferase
VAFPASESTLVTKTGPTFHRPVLAAEIASRAEGTRRAVDATLGGGGHTALLRSVGAEVLGIDRDPDAIAEARASLGTAGIRYLQAPFWSDEALDAVTRYAPDLVLLDLGVSSHQLDAPGRGFSFRPGAPLDMRMGQAGPTAADLLNTAPEAELRDIFARYGDERRAGRLAPGAVCHQRSPGECHPGYPGPAQRSG